jgi:hypothetical protein
MAEDPTVRARSAATGIRQQIAASVLQQQLEEMLKIVFSGPQLKQVDKWIAEQHDPAIDRPEAMRHLVELGLKGEAQGLIKNNSPSRGISAHVNH